MSNNTNQQAINFCNEKLRPVADAVVTAYLSMNTLIDMWNAQGLSSIIPDDSNYVQDGATVASGTPDGRPPITDQQVQIMISNCNTLLGYFQASSNLLLNQFYQIEVNGRSVI